MCSFYVQVQVTLPYTFVLYIYLTLQQLKYIVFSLSSEIIKPECSVSKYTSVTILLVSYCH